MKKIKLNLSTIELLESDKFDGSLDYKIASVIYDFENDKNSKFKSSQKNMMIGVTSVLINILIEKNIINEEDLKKPCYNNFIFELIEKIEDEILQNKVGDNYE